MPIQPPSHRPSHRPCDRRTCSDRDRPAVLGRVIPPRVVGVELQHQPRDQPRDPVPATTVRLDPYAPQRANGSIWPRILQNPESRLLSTVRAAHLIDQCLDVGDVVRDRRSPTLTGRVNVLAETCADRRIDPADLARISSLTFTSGNPIPAKARSTMYVLPSSISSSVPASFVNVQPITCPRWR